jgi:ABC-2 type transport system permease protein
MTFSLTRWWGIVRKEFLQLKRDRITFGMVWAFRSSRSCSSAAINTDPKQLPTAVVLADRSEFTRSYLAAMKTSGYFAGRGAARRGGSPAWRAARSVRRQFSADFSPASCVANARRSSSRPMPQTGGTGAALASVRTWRRRSRRPPGAAPLAGAPAPFRRVHKLYNPGIAQSCRG